MKTPKFAWIAVIMVLAAPGLLRAQSASVDTPNATVGCAAPNPPDPRNVPPTVPPGGAKMKVRIRANNPAGASLPQVAAEDIDLAACDNALTVANKEMDDILATALAADYTCFALSGGVAPPGTCGGATIAPGTAEQIWRFTAPGAACGFTLTKDGGTAANQIRVTPMTDGVGGFCVPTAVRAATNAGNPFGLDILTHTTVDANASGFPGSASFKVFHAQGGQNPRTFSVSLTGNRRTDHNAIKTGFDNTGLGMSSKVVFGGPSDNVGHVVLTNTAQVTSIECDGQVGQDINLETRMDAVPALGPWGMAVLFGLLLSTGYWVLRRRQRPAARLA